MARQVQSSKPMLAYLLVVSFTLALMCPTEAFFLDGLRRDIAKRQLQEILNQFPGILNELNYNNGQFQPILPNHQQQQQNQQHQLPQPQPFWPHNQNQNHNLPNMNGNPFPNPNYQN